jgi:hypothetical protein
VTYSDKHPSFEINYNCKNIWRSIWSFSSESKIHPQKFIHFGKFPNFLSPSETRSTMKIFLIVKKVEKETIFEKNVFIFLLLVVHR